MKTSKKEIQEFFELANSIHTKQPLTKTQKAIMKKIFAELDVYFRKVRYKNLIDIETNPEEYLRAIGELDYELRSKTRDFLNDEDLPFLNMVDIPLSFFLEKEKIKLSEIRVGKKGLDGQC